jgi:hypothetical protein
MKQTKLYLGLLVLFCVSGAVNYGLYLHFQAGMEPTDQPLLWHSILQIHATFITMVLGGIFAKRSVEETVPANLSWVSLGLVLAWSALVLSSWRSFPGFNVADKDGLITRLNDHASALGFLVAPMLAYLFGAKHGDV